MGNFVQEKTKEGEWVQFGSWFPQPWTFDLYSGEEQTLWTFVDFTSFSSVNRSTTFDLKLTVRNENTKEEKAVYFRNTYIPDFEMINNSLLKIRVLDEDGNPISNVEVTISSVYIPNIYEVKYYTNSSGYVIIPLFAHLYRDSKQPHGYSIHFKKEGYYEKYRVVFPEVGKEYNMEVKLKKEGEALHYTLFNSLDTGYDTWYVRVTDSCVVFAHGHYKTEGSAVSDEKHGIYYLDKEGNVLWHKHTDYAVWGIDVSEDGSLVFAMQLREENGFMLDRNGNILWETTPKLGWPEHVESREVKISHNKRYVAVGGGDGKLYLANATTGKVLWITDLRGQIRQIYFTKDDNTIYASSGDGYLYKIDVKTGSIIGKVYVEAWLYRNSLSISENEKYAITVSKIGRASFVDLENMKVIWYFDTRGGGHATSMTKNASFLAVASGGSYGRIVFDFNGTPLWYISSPSWHVQVVNDSYVLYGGMLLDLDGNVIYDLEKEYPSGDFNDLDFSYMSDDMNLLITMKDGKICFFERSTTNVSIIDIKSVNISPSDAEKYHFGTLAFDYKYVPLNMSLDKIEESLRKELNYAKDVGALWIRPHLTAAFNKGNIEEGDSYNWTIPDLFIGTMQEYNMQILIQFWNSPAATKPYVVLEIDDSYLKWLKAMVERYDGDGIDDMPGLKYPVLYYEVLNEPIQSNPEEEAEKYAYILKESYKVIKEANPNAKVLIGGLLQADRDLELLLENGCEDYFDIINWHQSDVESVKSIKEKFGIDKPMWITEFWDDQILNKYQSGENITLEDEKEQAKWLAEKFSRLFAKGVDKIFHVEILGHIKSPIEKNRHNPIEQEGACLYCEPEGQPRLAYYTYKLLAWKIGQFESARVVYVDGKEVYEFVQDGKKYYVVPAMEETIKLPVNCSEVKVIDLIPINKNGEFKIYRIEAQSGYVEIGPTDDPLLVEVNETEEAIKSFHELEKSHFSRVGDVKNATWVRFWVVWEAVQPKEGEYNFSLVDKIIKDFQSEDACILITIEPFANWDQNKCHGDEYWGYMPLPWIKVGKPCDMDAYKDFVKKLVERYDGDGIDDMPGLMYPIKYWEIMNEPDMQGKNPEDPKFFLGTPEEYLEILVASNESIKEADPEAKIVMGGMSSMLDESVKFWSPIIERAAKYFDIANIHTINTNEEREDLYMIKFKQFLENHGVKNKTVWITEVQYGDLEKPPEDIFSIDKLLVRSTVFSIALGADKLFYIDNWLSYWNSSSTQKAYETLVNKLAYFDSVEVLKQKYNETLEGAKTEIGQYKFLVGNRTIYVLWGNSSLPEEIKGTVRVSDIYGNERMMDVSEIKLTDSPVYVEVISQNCTLGDVNGDGTVDVLDLTYLVNIILGMTPSTTCSDVNGDGSVDVLDLTQVVNIILSM